MAHAYPMVSTIPLYLWFNNYFFCPTEPSKVFCNFRSLPGRLCFYLNSILNSDNLPCCCCSQDDLQCFEHKAIISPQHSFFVSSPSYSLLSTVNKKALSFSFVKIISIHYIFTTKKCFPHQFVYVFIFWRLSFKAKGNWSQIPWWCTTCQIKLIETPYKPIFTWFC